MAIKIAQSWEEVAETRATETQARKVVSDIYRQVSGRNLLIPSFESYRDQWLQRKQAEVKPVTYAHYKSVAAAFVHFLGMRAAEPIHYVETADVARWRDELAGRTSAKNANNRLKVLRCLFQSAWRDGISLDNPAAKVRTLRTEPSTRRAFTQDELRAIFRVATGEWRGIFLFGLYTGQRLADIVKLTWANFDPEAGVVRFTTNKTGRHQAIPLAPPILSYISELAVSDDPEAPIFPQAWAIVQRQGRTASLSNQFHGIMASAGLVEARPTRHVATTNTGRAATRAANPLSFHSLRHTTTSMLKMSGVPEAVVRDIIGHDSELISRLYTHVGDDMKRQAIVHLPDFTAQPASQVA